MKKRTFFLASIALVLVALVLHSVARDQILMAVHRKAKRIAAASKQQIRYTSDAETVRLSNRGHVLNKIGLVFMFSSLACVCIALIRREPGWYSIPMMLLIADHLLQRLL